VTLQAWQAGPVIRVSKRELRELAEAAKFRADMEERL
jgi:hypothetical protein